MNRVKWMLLLMPLMMVTYSSYAWNIGSKGRVTGPTIHSTYFLTNNNAPFPVHAQAYVGNSVNGYCNFSTSYDLGTETLQTGDFFDIDGFLLRSIIGNGYTCMTIFYTSKQTVMESFQLIINGFNYTTSLPTTSEVTIL